MFRLSLKWLSLGIALLVCAFSASAETFNVRFSWKLKGEYAPFYVALDKGYFSQKGLDVKLGEGAGSQAALGSLLQGQADAVVLPATFALSAIDKGMPIRLVAIYHPSAPLGLISLADRPIREPKDMEGKKLAVANGDTLAAYMTTLCKLQKIDCKKIDMATMDANIKLSQLIARRVDGVATYTNIEPPVIEATGEKVVVLDLSRYGLTLPGMSVAVREDQIAKRSTAIVDFLSGVDQ